MNTSSAPCTAIVEDHTLFRETIASVVDAMDELTLGPVLASAHEALSTFEDDRPDLVLIDLSLADMTGVDLTAAILERWPDVRCVILSGHRRAEYAQQALRTGALAYILKGRPDDFREGIRRVLDGDTFISEAVRPPHGAG